MNMFWTKLVAAGFLLFLALLVAGVIRSFSLDKSDLPALSGPRFSSASSYDEHRSSMATANNLAQIGLAETPLPQVLEQPDVNKIIVFDKTAQLASGTTAFTEDEKAARDAVAAHKAVTFSEKAGGIGPERLLVLGISVHHRHHCPGERRPGRR